MHWAWVFASPCMTVYAIEQGRGFEQAASILGSDFDGFLVRDGWCAYRGFTQAIHQSCLAHLLRRCREMIQAAGETTMAARFPKMIQGILQDGLELRNRRDQGQITAHGLAVARGQLEARMDRALDGRLRSPENQRLANHLQREQRALFSFLYCAGLEATNWRAEQAIRPRLPIHLSSLTPDARHSAHRATGLLK